MELNHEYRLIITSYKDVGLLKNLTTMVEHLRTYSEEISIAATNATTYMYSWKSFMDIFMQNSDSSVRKTALEQATNYKLSLDNYREGLDFEEKDKVVAAISDYVVFLRRLFNVDFNINYEVPIVNPVVKKDK